MHKKQSHFGADSTKIHWNCVAEKVFLDFPYLQIVERACRKESAEPESDAHRFYVLKARDWCNIIPVTEDGKLVIIRQFRAGTLRTCLEFPGGVVESSDADVQATALREMLEETGYEALPGARCEYLGRVNPNPALQDNQVHSLIVGPVKRAKLQALDPAEDIEVIEVPIAQLPTLLADAEFDHALMLVSIGHLLLKDPASLPSLMGTLMQYQKARDVR